MTRLQLRKSLNDLTTTCGWLLSQVTATLDICNFKEVDWAKFSRLLWGQLQRNGITESLSLLTAEDLDKYVEKLTSTIQVTIEEHVPMSKHSLFASDTTSYDLSRLKPELSWALIQAELILPASTST